VIHKRLLVAALAALVLGGLAVIWMAPSGGRQSPAQGTPGADAPRSGRFSTPYLNARPGVKYVGPRVCAGCHRDIYSRFRQHPMGQSLATVASASPIERYGPAACNPFVADSPFAAFGLHYQVRRQGKRVLHREWVADPTGKVLAQVEAEVQFVIGSGQRGRAYLVNHDGYLFQSPITWYPEVGRWDLAPGYEGAHNRHFHRPISIGCLFCHCDRANAVPDTVNRYQQPIFQGQAIGCERCHGPGELHVAARQRGEEVGQVDHTIVNPRRLEPELREAVCQQCHLNGIQRILPRGREFGDYRPGLPLHLFLADFVNGAVGPKGTKFLGTVEQMTVSRCYQASKGPKQLGCISCHDPHQLPRPEEKVAYYRGRCLTCHTESSCRLSSAKRRQKSEDNCIACHMPRTGSEIVHVAVTDHRILRRPDSQDKSGRSPPSPNTLVPFQPQLREAPDEETSRNLGLALASMLYEGPPAPVARQFAEKALPLLEAALQQVNKDPPAWQAKGTALGILGRREEALAAYERAVALAPQSESALVAAGKLALDMGRPLTSRSYLERAIHVNPWDWRYPYLLAATFYEDGEWDQAIRACRKSLELEPFNSTSRRKLLVECHLRLGQREQAQAAFELLLQLTPQEQREELQHWYEKQLP
jgi:hypothetical protein